MKRAELNTVLRRVPLVQYLRTFFFNNDAMIGWSGVLCSMAVFYFMGSGQMLNITLAHWLKPPIYTEAELLSVENTPIRVNNEAILKYHIRFSHQGQTYEPVVQGTYMPVSVGESLTVAFPADNPQQIRIDNLQNSGGFSILINLGLIGVFFPVCLYLALSGVYKGYYAAYLLRHGVLAHGRLLKKEDTRVKVGSQPVYKLTYEFYDDQNQPRTAIARTERIWSLTDEESEPLLYLPSQPSLSVLLDNLPGCPRIDEQNKIKIENIWGAYAMLLLSASIVAAGLWFTFTNFLTVFSL